MNTLSKILILFLTMTVTSIVKAEFECFAFTGCDDGSVVISPPTSVSVPSTNTSGNYSVTWGASSNGGSYKIYESTNSGTYYYRGVTTSRSFSISGRTDATYRYKVKACSGSKCSGFSFSSNLTVRLKPSLPSAPSGPSNSSTGNYTVSWAKPSGSVSYYDLQEKMGSGSWTTVANNTTATSKAFSKSSGSYSYRVRACNSYDWSCGSYSGSKTVSVNTGSASEVDTPPAIHVEPIPNVNSESDSVGSVEHQFRVTESGQASVSVPFYMPEGVAGVKPELGITYNSNAGNGFFGVGWSLTGLSSISRCAKHHLDDGDFGSVNFDQNDRFCLDGQKLVLVPGTGAYGSVGSEYRTIIDTQTKVTVLGTLGQGPSHFKVWRKDGSINEYGSEYSSKIMANNNGSVTNTVMTWMQSYSEDRYGNRISYYYDKNDSAGEFVIDRVEYGPNNRVQFNYSTGRSDKGYGYSSGSKNQMTKLLDSVEVYDNNYEVRRYDLIYQSYGSSFTKLKQIKESKDGIFLKPLVFTYSSNNKGITPDLNNNGDTHKAFEKGAFIDVDGDLIPERVEFEKTIERVYPFKIMELVARVYKFDKNKGKFEFECKSVDKFKSNVETNIDVKKNMEVFDLDGDGQAELLVTAGESIQALFFENGCPSTDVNKRYAHITDIDGDLKNWVFADVSGDALPDIVYTRDNKTYIRSHLGANASSSQYFSSEQVASLNIVSVVGDPPTMNSPYYSTVSINKKHFFRTDYDSDGRTDIIAKVTETFFQNDTYCEMNPRDPNCGGGGTIPKAGTFQSSSVPSPKHHWIVFASQGNNQFKEIFDYGALSSSIKERKDAFFADLNGDGELDVFYKYGSKWHYQINTGKTLLARIDTGIDKEKSAWFGDFDYDGKNEFLYTKGRTFHSKEFSLLGALSSTEVNTGVYGDILFQIDINADGEADFISQEYDQHTWDDDWNNYASYNKTPFKTRDRLITINNGLGNLTQITYKSLTDPTHPDLYTAKMGWEWKDNAMTYYLDMPNFVVQKVESSAPSYNNVTNMNAIEYRYGPVSSQPAKRGSTGFSWLETIDKQTNVIVRTSYSDEYPITGSPIKTETWYKERIDSRKMSEASSEYIVLNTGSYIDAKGNSKSIKMPVMAQNQELQWEFGATGNGLYRGELISSKINKIEYNSYGDAIKTKHYICPGYKTNCTSSGWLSYVLTVNNYDRNEYSWILARLKNTSVTHQRPGQSTVVRKSAFEYSSSTGILTAEIAEPNSTNVRNYLRKEYQHDQYGNVIRESICSYGTSCSSNPSDSLSNNTKILRVSTTQYDNDGRYVVSTKNGYGQIENKMLERNNLGLPIAVSDINGVISEAKFGTFGEEYFVRTESGTWSRNEKALCSSVGGCPTGAIVRIAKISAGGTQSYEYIDALGRSIKTQTLSFDGRMINVDNRYDTKGKLYQTSLPYFQGNSPAAWTTYYYDELGRVNRINDFDGQNSFTHFDGYSSHGHLIKSRIVNGIGQTKVQYKDALGQLRKIVDNANTSLTYQYNAVGDLTETYIAGSLRSRMSYDYLGRKIKMEDWDKGAQNGKAWHYEYNAKGELTKQTDAKGQRIVKYYDRLGRTTRSLEYNSSNALTSDARWLFDNATGTSGSRGKITKSYNTQNSEYVVEPLYDVLGRNYQTKYTVSGGTYYEKNTFDQFGRIFQSFDATGSNFGLRYVYNDQGFISTIREAKGGGSAKVYQVIKEMDHFGNITLENRGANIDVIYSYDHLTGRLIEVDAIKSNGAYLQELRYFWDTVGRMIKRQSVHKGLTETFGYDSLNRLKTINGVNHFNYDIFGNITYKKDVGSYVYGGTCNGVKAGVHAVSKAGSKNYCYDYNGNMTSDGTRTISYSTFDKVSTMSKAGHETSFSYNNAHNRYKRTDKNSSGTTKTYYIGSTEVIVKSNGQKVYRRNIPTGVATVSNGSQTTQYILKDHLGSTDVITSESGSKLKEMSFDAFGQKRQAGNWSQFDSQLRFGPLLETSRGYTGHEMADELGIINMNGRIYDPKLGRFLQADIIVDGPTDTQGFNRYTYVRNNPLAYTDPTGYARVSKGLKRLRKIMDPLGIHSNLSGKFSWYASVYQTVATIVAANFCGPCSIAVAAAASFKNTVIGGGNAAQGAESAFSAGVMSAVSYGIFRAAHNLAGEELINKMILHGIGGGIMSVLHGGKFGHGFASSFVAAGMSEWVTKNVDSSNLEASWTRVAVAAMVGGTVSEATGGKFINGAISAAMSRSMNDEGLAADNKRKVLERKFKLFVGIKKLNSAIESEFSTKDMEWNSKLASHLKSKSGITIELDTNRQIKISGGDGVQIGKTFDAAAHGIDGTADFGVVAFKFNLKVDHSKQIVVIDWGFDIGAVVGGGYSQATEFRLNEFPLIKLWGDYYQPKALNKTKFCGMHKHVQMAFSSCN